MRRLTLALLLAASATACRDCDDLGAVVPNGAIDPAVYDFGPITQGSECTAVLEVTNIGGRTDLAVEGARLLDDRVGSWQVMRVPPLVRLNGRESLEVRYVAEGSVGDVHFANIEVNSDDPDDDGILRASLRAIVTDEPAPTIKTSCGAGAAAVAPCSSVDFGAQQINGAGNIVPVTVINDGTADLEIIDAVINGGDTAFEVISVRRGSAVVAFPVVVPAGRSGQCGETSDADNTIFIDVRYTPTQIGANADTLVILSNAVNAPSTEVALSGLGSDVGILMSPDFIDFGELGEGETASIAVTVQNIGTREARVDESCIDTDGDDTCDARCTGQPADTALNGTLSCAVTTAAGARESLGFILAPTDARAGGDDERIVTVTWSPTAGASTIPAPAVLALRSAILGNRVFRAPLVGGSIGLLVPSVVSDDLCPPGLEGTFCIEATGDPADHTTWAGDITIRLTNAGSASLTIASFEFDGSPTINDDYTLTEPPNLTLAPGMSADLVVAYDEVGPGADAAPSDQFTNILVRHTGAGALTTLPLTVVRPR